MKMFFNNKFGIWMSVFLLLMTFLSCYDKDENYVEIKDWFISDICELADFDSASRIKEWKSVDLPYALLQSDMEKRFVWFKANFQIDDPEKYYGISLGNIWYSNEVFINGRRIGHGRPVGLMTLNKTINYSVGKNILKKDNNEIHIRIGANNYAHFHFIGKVILSGKTYYTYNKIISDISFNSLPLGTAILFACLALFNLIFFLFYRNEYTYLLAFLISISAISVQVLSFTSFLPIEQQTRFKMIVTFMPVSVVLFNFIIQTIYKVYFRKINFLVSSVMIFFSIVIWILHSLPGFRYDIIYAANMLNVIIVFNIIWFTFLFYTNHRVNQIKKDKINYLIINTMTILLILTYAAEGVLRIQKSIFPSVIVYISMPLYTMGIMIAVIRMTIQRLAILEILYDELKESLNMKKEAVSVSNLTEEKLNEVLKFIKNNYTSDISREGLAAAVGMSPDHLSRKFKAWSGKKINEYINELRIKKAEEMLKKSDEKITDIAFMCGYESPSAFNRTFRRFSNNSPSEFRQKSIDR